MQNKEIVIFMPSIESGGVEKNLFIISNYLCENFKKVSNEFLKWIQIADILIFYSWSEIGGVSNSVQISNCFGLVTQMPN